MRAKYYANRTKARDAHRVAIGLVVKQERERSGMSRGQLAKAIETSHKSIVAYETGTAMPSLVTAKRIAATFGMTLDELAREL